MQFKKLIPRRSTFLSFKHNSLQAASKIMVVTSEQPAHNHSPRGVLSSRNGPVPLHHYQFSLQTQAQV